VGLLGNAACVLAMGLVPSYAVLVAGCVVAGMFGSLFHPTANALVPALYPKAPGMAIGLLGIGSGIGFFAGPFYAGWSAQHMTWGGDAWSAWQRPCVELGVLGLLAAGAYLLWAKEAPEHAAARSKAALPPGIRRRTLLHAVAIALREFAGVGTITLSGLYMLKALQFDTARTGAILGVAMLFAAATNPVMVYLSSGARRLTWHAVILVVAAGVLAVFPFVPVALVLPTLLAFQTLALASSAVGDAGLAERLAPALRGRINGIFLTVVGTTAATSPWAVGAVVDLLGPRADDPAAYRPLFAGMALLVLAATASAWTLARLGRHTQDPTPAPVPVTAGTA
jgi:MFS family permease